MVPSSPCLIILTVVMLERLDEASLGDQSFQHFKVVVDYRVVVVPDYPLVESLITVLVVVDRSPDKVAFLDALRLILQFLPIAPTLEGFLEALRIVTPVDKVEIGLIFGPSLRDKALVNLGN